METARAHLTDGEPASDGHRRWLGNSAAVAQTPGEVVAPAVGLIRRGFPAGMDHPGANAPEGQASQDGARELPPAGAGAVAQLAVRVVTPAEASTGRGHPAGMEIADLELAPLERAGDVGWSYARPPRGAVSKLSVLIETPAEGSVVRRDAAAMSIPACGHLAKQETSHDRTRCRVSRGGPITELPVFVGPPAIRLARSRNSAGVTVAGVDSQEREPSHHLHRSVSIDLGTIAELA